MTQCEHIRPHKCRVSGKEAQGVDIIIKMMATSHPAKGGEKSRRILITSEGDSAELHLKGRKSRQQTEVWGSVASVQVKEEYLNTR